MDATMTVDPKAHDEAEAKLYAEQDRAQSKLNVIRERILREAGAKRDYYRRGNHWNMNFADALDIVSARADAHPVDEAIWGDGHPVNLMRALHEVCDRQAQLAQEIARMEIIYREHGWQRFFPCNNSNGHIHATLACHTLNKGQYVTDMGWFPSLSGHTVADAVAELGTWLCSVCFPDAPAEHCQTRSQASKAQRDAEKAQRDAAKLVKNLAESEQFRGYDGSWVTTVAGAKQALRDEVEFRDYYGRGQHPFHAASVVAADTAKAVLRQRQQLHGTGAAQAEIDQIVERAIVKNRKNGARI